MDLKASTMNPTPAVPSSSQMVQRQEGGAGELQRTQEVDHGASASHQEADSVSV